jgi:hypothetical protein
MNHSFPPYPWVKLQNMKKFTLLLVLCTWQLLGQGTPQLSTTQAFTSATTGAVIPNDPTTVGGPAGAVGFRMVYYIQPGSGTVSAISVELDGSPTSGGSYTALTPAVGGGSGSGATLNPVTSFPNGQNNLCCDYYPFLKIKVNTLTVSTGTPILIVKIFGYAGTSAAIGAGTGGGPPTGPAGGDLAGTYPNPTVTGANGALIPDGATCLATNSSGQLVASDLCGASLVYYLQNSVVASGTYTSGGTTAGTGTCTLSSFNGGGTGATASVPITGGVIAGGATLTITAAGTQYTSAPTSATLGSGTGTGVCSGTATIATVLNQNPSDISGDSQALPAPYFCNAGCTAGKTTMSYPISSGTGTSTVQTWATAPGAPGLSFIPAGAYYCHLHALRTNGFTGSGTLQCVFQEVDASGAFIATIGTTNQTTNLGLTEVEYILAYADPNIYTLASSSSRVQVLVQLVQNVTVTGTLEIFAGG